MDHVKFVILSSARSGTSHLSVTLANTQSIYCHGEIFHADITWHIKEEYKAERDVGLRDRDPIAYVEDIYSFCPPGNTHVGFKLWRSQAPEACDSILRDASVRKIILERENRLAAYSSGAKAQTSGIWNLVEGRKPNAAYAARSIETFNAAGFLNFVKTQDDLFRYYSRNANGPAIRVTYNDVVDNSAYETSLRFLGLAMPDERPRGKTKLNSSDILSRFAESERAKVVKTVTEAGHPEWLAEA
ncbi:MAG: hypothetical protein H0T75_02510 [Rhizobiales bacterium]|nr:hypothetical protein [Hyphomicrobiales bacterium]MDQ3557824.1 Stf0 sulfotransferase family protein [Pseudomonadota bacterium]